MHSKFNEEVFKETGFGFFEDSVSTINQRTVASQLSTCKKEHKKEKAHSCPLKMAVGGRINDSDSCHLRWVLMRRAFALFRAL